MTTSFLQKFMFKDLPVRGTMVVLDDVWQTVAKQKDYTSSVRQLLGELMVANVLLSSNLKFKGRMICQIQENSNFKLIESDCDNDLVIRATALMNKEHDSVIDYANLFIGGRLVVTLSSYKGDIIYQSVVGLTGESLDGILNQYMERSEQLRSMFLIAYSDNKLYGFILQQLPDIGANFTDEINRLFILAKTLTRDELKQDSPQQILNKLFHEDNVILYDAKEIKFACRCSQNRVENILRGLGTEEINDIINTQGEVSVACEYCATKYNFDKAQLIELLASLRLEPMVAVSNEIN